MTDWKKLSFSKLPIQDIFLQKFQELIQNWTSVDLRLFHSGFKYDIIYYNQMISFCYLLANDQMTKKIRHLLLMFPNSIKHSSTNI